MTETINVRINHKYDSYANWMVSTIKLGKGELAIAQIPGTETESGMTPPTIGVKIGDGEKTFAQLNWIQSIAGDVHEWAKKEALDFGDLSDGFKSNLSDYIGGEIQDTNTTYFFEYADDTLTIKSKDKTSDELTTVFSEKIDVSSKIDKVETAVEGNVVEFNATGGVKDSGKKLSDYLTTADAASEYASKSEYTALEELVSNINEDVLLNTSNIESVQTAIETLNGEATVEGSVKKQVADAIAGVVASAPEDLDTLKEISDYIASDKTGAAELSNKVNANATSIGALEELAHDHDNKLVLDGITEEKVAAWDAAGGNAKDYVDSIINPIDTRVTDIEGVLNGDTGLKAVVAGHTTSIEGLDELAHEHTDLTALNTITQTHVDTWNESVQTVSGVTTTKTGTNVEVTAVPVSLLSNVSGFTLIFDCGTASTVI